jgi:hypothetical protein
VPSGTIEAGRDAVTNQRAEGRLFVILLDDAMTPGDPYMGKMTRDVANRAVSEMQPGDLAAVVFAQDNRYAQDFTNDKLLLRQAIERFRSRPLECRMRESMAMGGVAPDSLVSRRSARPEVHHLRQHRTNRDARRSGCRKAAWRQEPSRAPEPGAR